MTKNLPKLMTGTQSQIQEAQRLQTRINPPKFRPWHIIFKLKKIKYKEKILKETRGEKNTYFAQRCAKVRTILDFSSETMEARGEW